MPSLLSTIRSWFAADTTPAPVPPTSGEILRRRIEQAPAFELGRYVVIGGYSSYNGEVEEQPRMLLEALADMREAVTSYDGSSYLHPVKVAMVAIDWLEIDYQSPTLGPVHIGMPAILDGRWIAHDLELMIDVAATAAIDAIMPRSEEMVRPVVERLAKLARFGDALMYTMKDESGAHVTLHSPFGPADVRQHDISGAPYAVYHLPKTEDFEDIPEGYEFHAWGLNMAIKRCRSMGYRDGGSDEGDPWERRRFIDRGLVYFDPTPLPDPNPHPPIRQEALVALDGRRVLTVRQAGQDTFSLPTIAERRMSYAALADRLGAFVGTTVPNVEWLTSGKTQVGSHDTPHVIVEMYLGAVKGIPSPIGDICEVHWLDIDAPDRPIGEGMRHSLLPAIRSKIDKNRS